MEAKKAAVSANKLISVDGVNAIVSVFSGAGAAISPIAEQRKVIHFGIAAVQQIADGAFNFIHWVPPSEAARAMAEELQKRGHKKIALLTINQNGFLSIRDRLVEKLAASGVEVVFNEIANAGEQDFRTIISKAKTTEPDIYIIMFFSPELEILTKQIREVDIKTPLSTIGSFTMSAKPEVYEGLWYVDAVGASKEFNESFETRFARVPQLGAPNAYDIVNILVRGFETATVAPDAVDGKPTQEAVVEAIHKVSFDGMTGKISIDNKGVVFSPASVKIIKDGKPVLLGNAL